MSLLSKLFGGWGVNRTPPVVRLADLPQYQAAHRGAVPPVRVGINDGEKFPGGFGVTKLLLTDYWLLRKRSAQLFETNIYARGLVRRLVVNEINAGLHLEASPETSLLGLPEDGLTVWSEDIENRFRLWGKDARLCDHAELMTFGQIQQQIRYEALVSGDVLVVLVQDKRTGLPRVKLVDGASVRTPLNVERAAKLKKGHQIKHGVETDPNGRQIAYWIQKAGDRFGADTFERLQAVGKRTGRRVAWLVYGNVTDKRMGDIRGKPLLTLVMQSAQELDKYKDSAQRKALTASFYAMFVKKTEDKPGTNPMRGGAVRKGTEIVIDSTGVERTFNVAETIPGVIIDELQHGEEPVAFPATGTDEKLGDFESAIISSIAWGHGVPPEILTLSFNSNYSASQAAINEFKIQMNMVRASFGDDLLQHIYEDWLLSMTLQQKVEAAGLVEAWRARDYETVGAWVAADWTGNIKPAVDMSKLVKGYVELRDQGWITNARAARELTGTKFSKNVKALAIENVELAEARAPLVEQEKPAPPPVPERGENDDDAEDINKEPIDDGDDDARALLTIVQKD